MSSTTGDLLEGSGLDLEEAGEHELKGLSGKRARLPAGRPAGLSSRRFRPAGSMEDGWGSRANSDPRRAGPGAARLDDAGVKRHLGRGVRAVPGGPAVAGRAAAARPPRARRGVLRAGGRYRFIRDAEEVEIGPGSFIYVPRGTRHAYRTLEADARTLILIVPAGLEGFFREMGVHLAARRDAHGSDAHALDHLRLARRRLNSSDRRSIGWSPGRRSAARDGYHCRPDDDRPRTTSRTSTSTPSSASSTGWDGSRTSWTRRPSRGSNRWP